MSQAPRLTAVILAGGGSKRMGSDKALLRLPDGRSTLEVVLETARSAASQVVLAVDSRAHADTLCTAIGERPEIVLDPSPGEGPLMALAAALKTASSSAVLLLAVDMPLVSAAAIRALHGTWLEHQTFGVHVVAPLTGGIVQPMPACYAVTLSGIVDQLLEVGRRSLWALLHAPAVHVHTIDEAAIRRFDPDLLSTARADTPEAWDELCARARRLSHA